MIWSHGVLTLCVDQRITVTSVSILVVAACYCVCSDASAEIIKTNLNILNTSALVSLEMHPDATITLLVGWRGIAILTLYPIYLTQCSVLTMYWCRFIKIFSSLKVIKFLLTDICEFSLPIYEVSHSIRMLYQTFLYRACFFLHQLGISLVYWLNLFKAHCVLFTSTCTARRG